MNCHLYKYFNKRFFNCLFCVLFEIFVVVKLKSMVTLYGFLSSWVSFDDLYI